jgi:pyruvate/2-oxoglutarate dehydrogenase complex dihydrolipoamide dehydrogenase (E3) component
VIFGLELCSAGHTLEEANKAGFDAREFSWSAAGLDEMFGGEPVSCSLIYDKTSHVLYGVQLAGWRALSYSDVASLAVSINVRQEDLAYLESSYVPMISRDESPIATTAKKALSSAR